MDKNERGIFCIEGMTPNEDYSFKQTLEFLSLYADFPKLFRPVDTRAQLVNGLTEWGRREDWKYPILYLSFHGSDREIFVKDPKGSGFDTFDLRTISRVVSDEYNMAGTLIHFAACSTLAVDFDELRNFFKVSGVTAVSGYETDVSWVESLSFELLYLDLLQCILTNDPGGDCGISPEQMHEVLERLMDSRKCRGLIDALGFNLAVCDEFDE